MVSTHTQYIMDHTPTSSDGKSPLAMLAKTCETIGSLDMPPKKTSHSEKTSPTSVESTKKETSPAEKRKERSPRATPTTSKADPMMTTTYGGMKQPGFPMGFPGGFPFYPGMMPFSMPFPAFPMAQFMPRPPCPSALMRQPCVTPGCTSCQDQQMQAFNPLYAAYAAMMPTSSASPMASYQSLLASAAAASAAKHTCSYYMESTGICGKQFSTNEELAGHMKSHATSPPSSTPDKTPVSSRHSLPRFHPYSKPSMMPTMPSMPAMAMPGMPMNFNPMALQAMYAQRMMMPHP